MCKESSSKEATLCVCGGTFAFMEQHWPHCQFNPDNMNSKTYGAGKALLSSLQAKFTKQQLAHIAQHGPLADKKIKGQGKRRKMGAIRG